MAAFPKEDLERFIALWSESVSSLQNLKLPVAIGQSLNDLNVTMFHTLDNTNHPKYGPTR